MARTHGAHAGRGGLLGPEPTRRGAGGGRRCRYLLLRARPGLPGGGTIIEDLPYGFASGVLLNMTDDPAPPAPASALHPRPGAAVLAELEPDLRARTAAILDSVSEAGACDFLSDVAVELPIQATCQLLGVPEADRHDLVRWTNATLTYEGRELGERSGEAELASRLDGGLRGRPHRPQAPGACRGSARRGWCRRSSPSEGGAATALSDQELHMFFSLMVAAGSETTRNAIALGVAALIEHPESGRLLESDPGLIPSATEEILRWTSPTLYNRRTATRDARLGAERIDAGRQGHLVVDVGRFRRGGVRGPVSLRRPPEPQPPRGLRVQDPLLPGRGAGPDGDPDHARRGAGEIRGPRAGGAAAPGSDQQAAGVCSMPVTFRRRAPRGR